MRLPVNFKTGIAIAVVLMALGVWTRTFWSRRAPDEADLRQTAGVTAMVLAAQPTARGWQVQCRVSNERSRAAEQVVLNLELTDSQGRVLAANPLAAVPNLAAADTRDVFFVIPFREPVTNAQVQAEVSLVRWRQ